VKQTEIALQLTWLAEACLAVACDMAREALQRFGRPTYLDGNGRNAGGGFCCNRYGKDGGE
jgi:[glutamine synthetase] adenylyltransferase / [glutamine synthetase]-adenylyl-L-tyrosine phosphorylase